jgi:cbb3-type cytochrome oxidase maturation protein
MSVLYIVIPLAMLVVAVALLGFVWSARRGQFDDLVTPALRILDDEGARGAEARGRDTDGTPRSGAPDRRSERGTERPSG